MVHFPQSTTLRYKYQNVPIPPLSLTWVVNLPDLSNSFPVSNPSQLALLFDLNDNQPPLPCFLTVFPEWNAISDISPFLPCFCPYWNGILSHFQTLIPVSFFFYWFRQSFFLSSTFLYLLFSPLLKSLMQAVHWGSPLCPKPAAKEKTLQWFPSKQLNNILHFSDSVKSLFLLTDSNLTVCPLLPL